MVPHFCPEPLLGARESSFLYRLGIAWEAVKDYWDVLRPMRFCVFVWIVITLLICVIPQSSDALLSLSENLFAVPPDIVSIAVMLLFAAMVYFWALETFYWARFMSRLPARARRTPFYVPPYFDDAAIETLNQEIPRHLGYLVLVSVWLALVVANRGFTLRNLGYEVFAAGLMAALMFAYRASVRRRRDIANAVHAKVGLESFAVDPHFVRDLPRIALPREVKVILGCLTLPTLAIYLASGFVRLWPWVAALSVVVWLIFGMWAAGRIIGLPRSTVAFLRVNIMVFSGLFLIAIAPDYPAFTLLSHLPSPVVIMSVAAAWVFVGTFFLALPGELLRLPIASLVVLAACVFSVVGRFDNHVIRVSKTAAGNPVGFHGTPLATAFAEWWQNVPKPADPNEPVPLVLVATSGGASRAAYWTAKVLTQIEKENPGFHRYVFAISSVSGGSLGAAVYEALLHDIAVTGANGGGDYCFPERRATPSNINDCALRVIDHDFLGPTFLAGLYPDLTQRFLPGALLPDRAAALERSWEEAWHYTMPNSSGGLDQPFHSLWQAKNGAPIWLPALIINGTSEKTGRKIITSNLKIENAGFIDAVDYFGVIDPTRDIPVSTAAHNSARFPYIDAAGTLLGEGGGMVDRIVDGGYFENFGAGSIYDLLERLRSPSINGGKKLRFFVIQITSDPELVTVQAMRDSAATQPLSSSLDAASDVTAPPVALFNTGSALGFRATLMLRDLVRSIDRDQLPHYAEFRLNDKSETLSWVLSRKEVGSLYQEWHNKDNVEAYQKLQAFMKWPRADRNQ